MKKIVFIVAFLTENPEAYRGVTNADVENGLREEVRGLPYVATVEKVTILDVEA